MRTLRVSFVLFLLVTASSFAFAAPAIVIKAANLVEGQQKVRQLQAAGPITQPVTVVIATGTTTLTEPIVFTPNDSGTADAPILYMAEKNDALPGSGGTIVSGGRKIDGWKKNAAGLYETKIADIAAGNWYFEDLYVNGKRAIRARTPNEFYFYTSWPVEFGPDPITGQQVDLSKRAFLADPNDLAVLKNVPTSRLNDVVVRLYHAWETGMLRIAAFDSAEGRVVCTGGAPWPLMRWNPRQRYILENIREALDAPGEWFLDRDGNLSYMPREGETPETLEAVAPSGTTWPLLRFDGTPDNPVEHLAFHGIAFRHAAYTCPPQGFSVNQAAQQLPAGIELTATRNVTFTCCEFAHFGATAVFFRPGSSDCRIMQCYLHDLGGGGVYMGSGYRGKTGGDTSAPTERITVENCIIREGGRRDLGAVGVWIGHASQCKIIHNEIADFFYTGISVGWQWGYQPARSRDNTIDFNHIHHLGQGVLSDMGGVYSLGNSPGTSVSNNVIHDVYSYSYGGWGLYTDEGSSDIRMENNLVYRVKTGTFHQHFGKDNRVRNNIFAFSYDGQLQRSREEEHHSFFYENNIVYWDAGDLLTNGRYDNGRFTMRNNLYWKAGGEPFTFRGKTLAEWQAAGHDAGSIIADPKFNDPRNGDFTLPADSPALKIGFQPFDYSKAGVYKDNAAWLKLAAEQTWSYPLSATAKTGGVALPEIPEVPPVLPLRIVDSFDTPRSKPFPKTSLSAGGRDDMMRLSKDRPASGEYCLEIRDAGDMLKPFYPLLTISPNHRHGRTISSFALRVRERTDLTVEWRDNSEKYKVGPTLRIRDKTLTVPGNKPINLPVDEWFTVAIAADVDKPGGTWTLTLTAKNGKKRVVENIRYGTADWQGLHWYGFAGNAVDDDRTTYYLDDFLLKNE